MQVRIAARLPLAACALIGSMLLFAIVAPNAHAAMTCNADAGVTVTPDQPGGSAFTTFSTGSSTAAEFYNSCTGTAGVTGGSANGTTFGLTLTVGGLNCGTIPDAATIYTGGPSRGSSKTIYWSNGRTSTVAPGTVTVREEDVYSSQTAGSQDVHITETSTITSGQFLNARVVETLGSGYPQPCVPRSRHYEGTLTVG